MNAQPAPIPRLTIAEALAAFGRREMTAGTRRIYTYAIKEFLAAFPDILYADQIDKAVVERYQVMLRERGLTNTTRHTKLSALKRFVSVLEDQGIIAIPYAAKIALPKPEKHEPRYLSEAEYKALMREAAHHTRDAAMLEVLLQTGIRLSELVGLTISPDCLKLPDRPSVNATTGFGYITVRRKRGKVQQLPVNYKACRAIAAYLKVRPESEYEQLFLTKYATPMTSRSVQKAFKKYVRAAGIPWAHPHTLRTTMITHHIAKGTPITDVKDLVGHESIATTNVYAGLIKESQIKSVQEHAL